MPTRTELLAAVDTFRQADRETRREMLALIADHFATPHAAMPCDCSTITGTTRPANTNTKTTGADMSFLSPHQLEAKLSAALQDHPQPSKLLAVAMTPACNPRDQTPTQETQWRGHFISAHAGAIIFGTFIYRTSCKRPVWPCGITIQALTYTHHKYDANGNATADAAAIEHALRADVLWWVPAGPYGLQRPCGMMARRIQSLAREVIATANEE